MPGKNIPNALAIWTPPDCVMPRNYLQRKRGMGSIENVRTSRGFIVNSPIPTIYEEQISNGSS